MLCLYIFGRLRLLFHFSRICNLLSRSTTVPASRELCVMTRKVTNKIFSTFSSSRRVPEATERTRNEKRWLFGRFRGRRETKPEDSPSILNKFPIISVVFDRRSSSAAAFSFTARLNSILFLFFFSILHPRSSKAKPRHRSLSARASRRLEDNKFLISRLNFLFRPMDHRALSPLMIRLAQFNNSSSSVAFLRSQRATERAKEREKVKGSLHVKATHTGEWASSCSELGLGLSPSGASSARLRLSSLDGQRKVN